MEGKKAAHGPMMPDEETVTVFVRHVGGS